MTLLPASDALESLLSSPGIASKRWAYRQYDHTVRTNTVLPPGLGPGVVRIKGTTRALAISVDGNGRYCYLDPYRGAMLAVAEAARNVACCGAMPIGATNCLNFGNPERAETMWQFARAVEGIGVACRALEIPITGGNVSLYNETDGQAIYPTPVLGVVGLIDDSSRVVGRAFRASGDAIVLLGPDRATLGGSEYLKTVMGRVCGLPPEVDLALERALQALLRAAVADRLILSAHDVSDGGVAVTLAECTFDSGGIGAIVDVPPVEAPARVREAVTLFGESAGRVVVSAPEEAVKELTSRARAVSIPARVVGRTGGPDLCISIDSTRVIDVEVARLERLWSESIEKRLVPELTT